MLTKPIHSFFANTEEFVQDKDVRRSILANSIKALPDNFTNMQQFALSCSRAGQGMLTSPHG